MSESNASDSGFNYEKESLAWDFVDYATQYYLLGRVSATHQMFYTAGWMFRCAVEYFLKGGLINYFPPEELKKTYGHNVEKLWVKFKTKYPLPNSRNFDEVIANLNAFSQIRYPDGKDRNAMVISISMQDETLLADELENYGGKIYRLNVNKLDVLVNEILVVQNRKPSFYFGKYKNGFNYVFPPLPKELVGDLGGNHV